MSYQHYNTSHSGDLIRHTYIGPFEGVASNGVADRLGVARSTFSRLFNGQSGISLEMAIRFSKVLGGSAKSWLALQKSFDLSKVRKTVDTSALKRIEFNPVA